MKTQIHLLKIILIVVVLKTPLYAQSLSEGEGYSTSFDDYFCDMAVKNGVHDILIKEKLFTYPQTVYCSFLSQSNYYNVSPINLGSDFSALKVVKDSLDNVYIAGIYSPTFPPDTSYVLVTKLDKSGALIWNRSFHYNSDSLALFIDKSDHIYISDQHNFIKLDSQGTNIWEKQFKGIFLFEDNLFYNIYGLNINEYFLGGLYGDTLIFQKIDTAGTIISSKPIIQSTESGTYISTNVSMFVNSGKLYINGNYWGSIDLDPSANNDIISNYEVSSPHSFPVFRNYIVIYDTTGNFIWSHSNDFCPKVSYFCSDSAHSIYISGPGYGNYINTNDTISMPGTPSYLAKYDSNMNFLWGRGIMGRIKSISTNLDTRISREKLSIGGDYNGNIGLNLADISQTTFTSQGYDVFYAEYIDLNSYNSPTFIKSNYSQEKSINCFPNPSNGKLFVNFPFNKNKITLNVFDTKGLILTSKNILNNNSNESIDLSSLDNGIYILQFVYEDKVQTIKITLLK